MAIVEISKAMLDALDARIDALEAGGGGGGVPATSVVAEQAFGQATAVGTGTKYAREDHTHGTPTNPVTAHEGSYNHSLLHSNTNDPSAGEKAALAGTSGTPSGSNKYVTDADSRNTNARTPTAHASGHVTGGSDIIANAVAGGNAGLMTGADKAKLDGIAAGAVAVIQGLEAEKPAPTGSGNFYWCTDSHKLYFDDGVPT